MVKIVGKRKLSDSYLINLTCFWADIPYGVKNFPSFFSLNYQLLLPLFHPRIFQFKFVFSCLFLCILENQDPLGFESGIFEKKEKKAIERYSNVKHPSIISPMILLL